MSDVQRTATVHEAVADGVTRPQSFLLNPNAPAADRDSFIKAARRCNTTRLREMLSLLVMLVAVCGCFAVLAETFDGTTQTVTQTVTFVAGLVAYFFIVRASKRWTKVPSTATSDGTILAMAVDGIALTAFIDAVAADPEAADVTHQAVWEWLSLRDVHLRAVLNAKREATRLGPVPEVDVLVARAEDAAARLRKASDLVPASIVRSLSVH